MSKLIDVNEAIINFGFEWDDIPPTRDEFVAFLKKQPTIDAVPVVRCRECKKSELVPDFDGLYSCRGKRKPLHDPDDFCNFGVKREDG